MSFHLIPNRLIYGTLLIFLINGYTVTAQSLSNIVEKHIAAMGGREKLDSLNTIIMEGTFRLEGFELPLKGYLKNREAQRYNVSLMKTPGYVIITQKGGWQYFPFQGMKEPLSLKADELSTYLPYMDLQGALYNFKEKNNKIEYHGMQDVDDLPCYKLLITLEDGKQMTTYISAETFYITKTTMNISVNGKEQVWESLFANYQKTKEGYVFPFALTLGPGKAFVNKIIINPPIDPTIFDPVSGKTAGF